MNFRRPLVLAASALALVIAACSTPADLTAPGLEPQFGTADNDFGADVASVPAGGVLSLSEQARVTDTESTEKAVLRRYGGDGTLNWARDIYTQTCNFADDFCTSDDLRVRTLAAGTQGHSYALVTRRATAMDCAWVTRYFVLTYDAAGDLVRSLDLGRNGDSLVGDNYGAAFTETADLAVDGSGNLYVLRQDATFTDDFCKVTRTNVVTKYSAAGTLQWRRNTAVGTPSGVSVSGDGNVYVAGSAGVARYTGNGVLNWTRSGAAQDLAAVGTNTVYARNLTTVRKLDASGKQLWSKAQSGLSGMVVGDMTADGGANVYLTGKYSASPGNRDVFTRKLNAQGGTVFTKTFGTTAYDDARGVATLTGGDIYLTGATQGSLAHAFRGGDNDGYVRKLSSSGGTVWTR